MSLVSLTFWQLHTVKMSVLHNKAEPLVTQATFSACTCTVHMTYDAMLAGLPSSGNDDEPATAPTGNVHA